MKFIHLALMNAFLGNKYTEEEISGMLDNGLIKENDLKYLEMLNKEKMLFL